MFLHEFARHQLTNRKGEFIVNGYSRLRIIFSSILRGVAALAFCGLPLAQAAYTQAAPHATILLHPDYDCAVQVDGAVVGHLKSGAALQVRVTLGQHLVQADSSEGYHWESVVDVKQPGQIVLPIPLQGVASQAAAKKAQMQTASRWVGVWTGGVGYSLSKPNDDDYGYAYQWYAFHIDSSGQCNVTFETSFENDFAREGESKSELHQRVMDAARTNNHNSTTIPCQFAQDGGISVSSNVNVSSDAALTFDENLGDKKKSVTVPLRKAVDDAEANRLRSKEVATQQAREKAESEAAVAKALDPLMDYFRGSWHFNQKIKDDWYGSLCEANKDYEANLDINDLDTESQQLLGTMSYRRSGSITKDETSHDDAPCAMRLESGEKVTDFSYTEEWDIKIACEAPSYTICKVTGERTSCPDDCPSTWRKEIGEIDFPAREPQFFITEANESYWSVALMEFFRN
ncbi:MAG: hypothetical protein ACRD40_15815 [Candidatus Acidiferrales bacterium]